MISGPRLDRDHPLVTARRVARNTVYLTIADAAGKLLMFVFFIVAARQLGVEQYGVLSFALAFVAMFAVLADLGLGAVTAREIARDGSTARQYVNSALTIKLIASVVLIAAVALVVRVLGYSGQAVTVTVVTSGFILVNAVALLYTYVFQGYERTVFSALVRILQTAALTLGALVLARGQSGVVGYAWLYVGAAGLGALAAWMMASIVFVRPGLSFDLPFWRSLLGRSLPIGLAAAFAMLYYWNGSALLSRMSGDAAVGIYSASFRLVMGLGFIAQGFSGAVYPVMSRLYVSNRGRLEWVFSRSFQYIVMLAVGLVVVGSFLSRPAIMLLYGAEYEASVPVLAVLVWWGGFMCLNVLLSFCFYAADQPRVVTRQTALALALNLGLNLLLIPRYGAFGVAVAIVVAEGAGCCYLVVVLSRSVLRWNWRRLLRLLPRAAVAAGAAGVAGLLATRWYASVGLLLGITSYPLFLLGLRALAREDIRLIKSVVGRGDGSR
ncbi:MAG: flippase [bacterium]